MSNFSTAIALNLRRGAPKPQGKNSNALNQSIMQMSVNQVQKNLRNVFLMYCKKVYFLLSHLTNSSNDHWINKRKTFGILFVYKQVTLHDKK